MVCWRRGYGLFHVTGVFKVNFAVEKIGENKKKLASLVKRYIFRILCLLYKMS